MIMDCGKPMIIRSRACDLTRHAQHIPIAGRSKSHIVTSAGLLLARKYPPNVPSETAIQ
jgi:hypothetical protein